MLIKLKDFVASGRFGNVKIGSTKKEVIAILGVPKDTFESDDASIMYYGWYEIHYWRKTEMVFGIHNDHLQADCLNHAEMINFQSAKWTLDKWILIENRNRTLSEVVETLTAEKIPFDVLRPYDSASQDIIKCLHSDVCFTFASEYSMYVDDLNGQCFRKDFKEDDQLNYVLHAISLFKL